MPRYFIEVGYKGAAYSGFQVQQNANSVQAEVEKALKVYLRTDIGLTGSSRTDAGVHALQNFFHFDLELAADKNWEDVVYHLNAILPADIVIHSIRAVDDAAHCRFDAVSRTYEYTLYRYKDPFLQDRAYYFPYRIDIEAFNEAAALIKATTDFQSFAKRNSQVHTYECHIYESEWIVRGEQVLVYRVRGSRFLRGMVRGLVGTMLRVGTGKISIDDFVSIIKAHDLSRVDFSVPAHGLTLHEVRY